MTTSNKLTVSLLLSHAAFGLLVLHLFGGNTMMAVAMGLLFIGQWITADSLIIRLTQGNP